METRVRFTRKRLVIVVAFVLIAIVAGYLIAPLFITTQRQDAAPPGFTEVIKEGTWQGADSFHFARGSAKILGNGEGDYVLRLENFEVRNGPDIEFFLSTDPSYGSADIGLGDVISTTGSYNVPIPAGTDVGSVNYILVWCVPFGVLFGTAALS